jgi:phage terminase large subunit
MSTVQIKLPPKLIPLFTPARGDLRFRVAHGGRGSGKSFTFALMAAVWGYIDPLRVLCTRELQNSIKESFHAELKNAIASQPWLEAAYDVGVDYIRGSNGTEFIFKGLRHNQGSIKSLAQIDLCIVEEAADVPKTSWDILLPTIRAPKSEIWVVYNPRKKDDPVDKMFREGAPPPRSMVVEVNHDSNPWFPDELEEQRKHAQQVMDDALYQHVWEGNYYELSDSQIFRNKYHVEEFEPTKFWGGPYYGKDFGFAQDPTVAIKSWVWDRTLYIEYAAGAVGLELDDTAEYMIERIPGIAKGKIRADSARPESISYLARHGLPYIEGVKKGPGSVEDGIEHIKSYNRIVIHPRCKEVINEFRLYSYKTDRLSGEVQPVPVDANNHYIDAIRYALRPLMSGGTFDYSRLL